MDLNQQESLPSLVCDPVMSAPVERKASLSSSEEKADLKAAGDNPAPDVSALDCSLESGQTNDAGLVQRIDLWIVPMLFLLNFGAARIDTLGVTLMGFKNNDYWVSLLVFFIGCW